MRKDTVDLQSSAIMFTAPRLDHEVRVLDLGGFRGEGIYGAARPSLRTSRFVCLRSVESSPQEKRHH